MTEELTVYLVKKYDLTTGREEILAEVTDPAQAYDLAHEFDCAVHLGVDGEGRQELHPCDIRVEDKDGNDMWQECLKARCPSAGLFQ
ncbi:hypothetical protein LCGC14_1419340 [marine sediment metagenome]|uniref:Uncharacterized protein n=1 Tax=marine sediment metagenome TaxID=412755 RepID=A0A0F9MTJ6_9ZZZZ